MSLSWDNLCRLCANTNNCNSYLFSEDGERKGILQFIEKFLSITISPKDGLPSKVCQDCWNKVIEFHNYSIQCEKIQLFFRKYNESTIELHNDEQLQCLKSEFKFNEIPEIKIELHDELTIEDDDCADLVDDDLDYLPLSDLVETKRTIPRLKIKQLRRKSGRPKKNNVFNEQNNEVEDKKIFTDLDQLLTDYKDEKTTLDDDSICNNSKRGRKTKSTSNKTSKEAVEKVKQNKRPYFKGQYGIFKFNCHVCEKEWPNWNALKVHVRKVHKCNAKVLCVCFKYLSSRKTLKQHVARHNPDKSFQCTSCDKAFGYKRDLDTHLLQHIPKEELPFVCCKCAKRFTSARILKNHEKVHVPREERFIWPCDLCGSKFSTKGAVATHKRVIHEKIKPFVCDLCGHTFSTKANMEEHRTRHMDIKSFVCNECNKGFKTKGALVRHMDTHGDTAYQCPHCPMLLNSKRTLRNHMYVHDDTASHICPFCAKAFKRRKECKSHMKLHTGERPYTCPWCPRSFTNGSNCRIHKRRMHPQEFAIAEETNPFAPTNVAKSEPKKIIHASFKNPAINKIKTTADQTVTIDDKSDKIPMEDI